MLHVEVSESIGLDLYVEVLFQLQTSLLQAHEAPLLQHPGIEQVPADPGHNLEASVVLAVVTAPIDELPIALEEALEGHEGSCVWTMQDLSYLLERVLQVEVHFVDSPYHGWRDRLPS